MKLGCHELNLVEKPDSLRPVERGSLHLGEWGVRTRGCRGGYAQEVVRQPQKPETLMPCPGSVRRRRTVMESGSLVC